MTVLMELFQMTNSILRNQILILVLLMAVCPVQKAKVTRKTFYTGLLHVLALNYCHGGTFPP